MKVGNPRQLTCKVCHRPEKFDFYVPDEVWVSVVPIEYQGKVVCLCCFDDFAKDKDINYSRALQDLCFVGQKATFRFSIAWSGDD